MKKFRVLHLSDIHIGDTYMSSKDIAYRMISDIENEKMSDIQCVVVTGDIFEGKLEMKDHIVDEAVKFFNVIFEQLKNTCKIEKTDFLFVPGNHDIIRTADKNERWVKYRAFLNGFYDTIPDFYDEDDFSLLKVYPDDKIVFAGFNSCGLEEVSINGDALQKLEKISAEKLEKFNISKKDLSLLIADQSDVKTFADYGEIPTEQILKMNRNLKKYDDFNIIALFHHHFYLFPEVHKKHGDSSLIRNYTNVIQQMQQTGIKTVLHGHKHFDLERPLITDLYYENANNVINVIAGGSVGTNRTVKHTFNIIDFFDKENNSKIIQRKFTYNDDQLEPVVPKHIPPETRENNNNIKLYSLFELNAPELYAKYINAVEKINIVADDYDNIIKWLENIFAGFEEIHKLFRNNPNCLLFLLFAMNYRVLKVKKELGKQDINSSYFNILNELLDEIGDTTFDKKQYLKIFDCIDLSKLKEKSDVILNELQNKNAKQYLAFSMVAIFVTDIYLMLRYYAGSFYNKYIKYKVNIKLDETEFHQNIPVQKIMIHSDADRRSAFIDLKCNSATAHKLAVLFVKEFELIISKFEDYFKIIGLKLYYITPKIEKDDTINPVDNYNFEAYIPTLIPLLTGDNIYSKKEVFARELIQNSIDAIAVRASKESSHTEFDKSIHITLGQSQNRKFFRIKDCGTGMDRFKIERYFTSIGRSFYSGDEYRDLDLEYKPISNFGIGFLSAFMVCREIDVKTKYYLEENNGLKLHIPNYDGCFFIEKDNDIETGTEITLYLDKKICPNVTIEGIFNYIVDTMRDVNCDIHISDEINKKDITLNAFHSKNTFNKKSILFIPFLESGKVVEDISVENDIWTGDFKDSYPYGLAINLEDIDPRFGYVLNSGIKLNDTDPEDVWEMLIGEGMHRFPNNMFLFNFPSNYIDIDVARERINNFSTSSISSDFSEKLVTELLKQIQQYTNLSKDHDLNTKAINIQFLIRCISFLCSKNKNLEHVRDKFMRERYILYVCFNDSSIDLIINKPNQKPQNAIAYSKNNQKKYQEEMTLFVSKNSINFDQSSIQKVTERVHQIIPEIHHYLYEFDIFDEGIGQRYLSRHFFDENYSERFEEVMRKIFKVKDANLTYAILLLMQVMLEGKEELRFINTMDTILMLLLRKFSVSDVENNRAIISVQSEDIQRILKRFNNRNNSVHGITE